MDKTAQRSRRKQIRSAETREKLIKTTLDVIFDVGYHAATTQKIADRARVSRGALLHHFPTRADIILAAMDRLLHDGTEDIHRVAVDTRNGKLTLDDFVEFLWKTFSSRFFYLSLEMLTEARNDEELKQRMIPVVKNFHNALDANWVEFCDQDKHPARQAKIILNMTVCLMRGMGLQSVTRPDALYFREMVEAWKNLLPKIIDGPVGEIMFAGPWFRQQ